MKVLVIGATGGVGGRLVEMLVEAGHEVTGTWHSDGDDVELQRQGVTPRFADLTQMGADDFGDLVQFTDAVVFSAGAGGAGMDLATAIDGDAPIALVQAMEAQGVARLVLVSVFPEAGRDQEPSDGFEHYMAQKKRADVAVCASGLDWVLIRPGTLQDDDGDGRVNAGRCISYGDVARGNVARAIHGVLERPELSQEIIELTDGDTDVDAALDDLVR
ncbi:putative sugar epimerase YhfK [Rhodobacteraceae bacterium THAF1]|uniref:NAD(P)H-binding protein n=1 Tax=Palleronia sp. THAF1 TaxID=2587842 RepID=UPI000F3F193B|nr:NAD(P)H-binding protein [Palleronia sp. THAF1]QFU07396.1 putative sugar epimerase YhfK [Palleronia sp. THAF1]VDC20692.1 putative sugar epimerase YhfK [Rhodobacteraceae bacterium THAF1]